MKTGILAAPGEAAALTHKEHCEFNLRLRVGPAS